MGGENSKKTSDSIHLSESEQAELQLVFQRIQGKDSSNASSPTHSTVSAFKLHFEMFLDDWMTERLISLLVYFSQNESPSKTKNKHSGTGSTGKQISSYGFLKTVKIILKEELDEKVKLILQLALGPNLNKNEYFNIKSQDILQYTRSFISSCVKTLKETTKGKSWSGSLDTTPEKIDNFSHYILLHLFYPHSPPKDSINQKVDFSDRNFTYDELIAALGKSSIFLNLHNSLFSKVFEFDEGTYFVKNLIPTCLRVNSALTPINFSLLDMTRVLFLNSNLPVELQSKWRFLFSTACHGESFSKVLSSIVDKGATILIIQDENGRIFGGFASESWKLGPKFYGTSQSFLFHIFPSLFIYSPTSFNGNYQYINLGQKTLPNGLGMGGSLEYFGLWIDSEFGKGVTSPSCTTYASPQLSQEKEFTIRHLEVWGVGPEPLKEEGLREPQSILDKDPEVKAVLEIMGKNVSASDGYRNVTPNLED